MKVLDRAAAAYERAVAAGRRFAGFDHFWRAKERYGEVLGGRLAAAIAYYGFFAVFALGLVAYSVFGFILNRNAQVRDAVNEFLTRNLAFIKPEQIAESSGTVGVIGLIGLMLTGVAWVETIRSSQRLIYHLDQQPGNLVIRRLVDLVVLVGVVLLLVLSVAAVDALESLLRWVIDDAGAGLGIFGWVLTALVNMVLATALLVAVPRLRMPARRLIPSVLLVSVGITLLNTVGRAYVVRVERNPAYTIVATTAGLLVYLYLLNQLLLFAAALAATDKHGDVIDLADSPLPGEKPEGETGESPPPAAGSENPAR